MSDIRIHNLEVKYDQVTALKDVTFEIIENEFLGIIGPNGGGKTTLVKAILGLIEPTFGTITVDPLDVIGYVPQLTTFDRHFPITVMEVILMGHLPRNIKIGHRFNEHDKNHAMMVMKRLKIDHLSKRQIGQLSGGQMQRVLIARALMNHPNILILDEPTASVDEKTKESIYKMLKELNKKMTVIMITHDTALMWPYLDRVIYINKTVHLHDQTTEGKKTEVMDTCPIDWFIEGEKIQKELLIGKGAKND